MAPGKIWALAAMLPAALAAQSDHPCAACHPAEAASQPRTLMGRAMETPGRQELLKQRPKWSVEANGYRYSIESKDGINIYTVTDGSSSLSLPIRYAFGTGAAGQTFVFEHEGRFYESMVSYYRGLDSLAVTVGSERLKPKNLVEAMGRDITGSESLRCFGCHSTNGVSQGKVTPDTMRPGLQCEHCHPEAAAHMEALKAGKDAAIPKRLGELSAEDMSQNCGECHRTWDTVVRMRTWGEVNVRFEPYRLANSKCFLGNDDRIKCTACHDPHADLVRDDAAYDVKCQACHGKAPVAGKAMQKPCPVSERNCVSCHMPKVEVPGGHAIFADHQIRIVRAGDKYPN